jgi:hypothetical protein
MRRQEAGRPVHRLGLPTGLHGPCGASGEVLRAGLELSRWSSNNIRAKETGSRFGIQLDVLPVVLSKSALS